MGKPLTDLAHKMATSGYFQCFPSVLQIEILQFFSLLCCFYKSFLTETNGHHLPKYLYITYNFQKNAYLEEHIQTTIC